MRLNEYQNAMRALNLPCDLIAMIHAGTLERTIAEAFARIDELNARLDVWEACNPDAAVLTPWYVGREAWKAAGRPRPEWFEALKWHGSSHGRTPVNKKEIRENLLNLNTKAHCAKLKAAGLPRRGRLRDLNPPAE